MAIEALYLSLLKQAIERKRASHERLSALFLGYPDIVIPRAVLGRMFGEPFLAALPVRADPERVWHDHALDGVADPVFETVAFFGALGVDVTVVDVAAHRGMERHVDLNLPLPQDLVRSFDLVADVGTCEHCFNVAQAFSNACEALRQGGVLMHAAPLTRINHGFWSFNPTVYPDFFEANGFDLKVLIGVTGTLAEGVKPFPVEAFARFQAPPETTLYVVAERREIRPIQWPVQRKYRAAIG